MGLRKVPPAEWARVLDAFSRERLAGHATVYELRDDVQATWEACPLRAVEFESADCVAIRFADDAQQVLRVEAPRVLRMDEDGLVIDSERGTTRMRLRGR